MLRSGRNFNLHPRRIPFMHIFPVVRLVGTGETEKAVETDGFEHLIFIDETFGQRGSFADSNVDHRYGAARCRTC